MIHKLLCYCYNAVILMNIIMSIVIIMMMTFIMTVDVPASFDNSSLLITFA